MAWTIQSKEARFFEGSDPKPIEFTVPKGCTMVVFAPTDLRGRPLWPEFVPTDVAPSAVHDLTIEGVTHRTTRRMAQLLDGLFAAFVQTHQRVERIGRCDDRGRLCQYPADGDWATKVTAEMLALASGLATAYFKACAIPPEECMLVSWLDGTTWRTEYERRPEAWV